MTTEPNYVVWLDLETTGLDEGDQILEVACVVTDMALNEKARLNKIVHPSGSTWLQGMSQYVLEMHVGNGLLAKCRDATEAIDNVDRQIATWLKKTFPKEESFAIGGSGVAHFDRRFIKAWMPYLDECLTYWSLDVGVLRRFLTRLGGYEFERLPIQHRAMADVEQSISEAKRLLDAIQPKRDAEGRIA